MIEVFLGEFLFPFGLCSKLFRYREEGHYRAIVNAVRFYFVKYLDRVGHCFGQIAKHFVHLFPSFEPLLFGVAHAFGIV